jgi:hypothetical protein
VPESKPRRDKMRLKEDRNKEWNKLLKKEGMNYRIL